MGFSFSAWFGEEMKKRHMTRQIVSDFSGVATSLIYDYQHGLREPTIRNMNKILDVFGKKLVIVDKEEE